MFDCAPIVRAPPHPTIPIGAVAPCSRQNTRRVGCPRSRQRSGVVAASADSVMALSLQSALPRIEHRDRRRYRQSKVRQIECAR
jgi:hypothetical protein